MKEETNEMLKISVSIPRVLHIMFLLLILSSMVHGKRGSRKSHRSEPCTRGCSLCDGVNGCVQCRSRMFLFLNTVNNRQVGICKHDCPSGYFGQRGRSFNKCTKCEVENCKNCFTSTYCTACQKRYFLHAAKCQSECPEGLVGNVKTGKCEDKADCVVSSWSSWSKCARRSPSRSCKYGRKKRTRDIVQEASENGEECPNLKEAKRCKPAANNCICEWNRDEIINKWLQRMDKIRKRIRNRKSRKRDKNKGKKRKRKNKIESNSTVRLNDIEIHTTNMTSKMPLIER